MNTYRSATHPVDYKKLAFEAVEGLLNILTSIIEFKSPEYDQNY
ncbi:MAG: hypothetical protein ACRYE7_00325 [Janthinobacterium lividum]